MKKIGLVWVMAGLVLSLIAVVAYAHEQASDDASDNENDYMDEMHGEMTKYIDDPELREEMGEMHEACEELHENNGNAWYMMGWPMM